MNLILTWSFFVDDSLVYHLWTWVCSQPVSPPRSPRSPAGRCTSCCGHFGVALWGKWDSRSVWGTRIRLLYQAARFLHRPPSGGCWFYKDPARCTLTENTSVWLHHLSVDLHLDFVERLRGNVSKHVWGDIFVLKTNWKTKKEIPS